MFMFFAFAVAFGTAMVWSRLFLRRNKFDPGPRHLLVSLFLAGCLITIPSALVEHLIPGNELTGLVIIGPMVEEGFKLAAVVLVCWPSRHFNQLVDGAIYGISCGLGFAAVENLLYGISGGFGVLGLRALIGPISHPLFTGVSGFYLARARFEGNARLAFHGLLLAALLHAGWNLGPGLMRATGSAAYGVVFLVVVLLYVWLLRYFLGRLGRPDAQRLRVALALGTVSTPREPVIQ